MCTPNPLGVSHMGCRPSLAGFRQMVQIRFEVQRRSYHISCHKVSQLNCITSIFINYAVSYRRRHWPPQATSTFKDCFILHVKRTRAEGAACVCVALTDYNIKSQPFRLSGSCFMFISSDVLLLLCPISRWILDFLTENNVPSATVLQVPVSTTTWKREYWGVLWCLVTDESCDV